MDLKLHDVVELKKEHPCGSRREVKVYSSVERVQFPHHRPAPARVSAASRQGRKTGCM